MCEISANPVSEEVPTPVAKIEENLAIDLDFDKLARVRETGLSKLSKQIVDATMSIYQERPSGIGKKQWESIKKSVAFIDDTCLKSGMCNDGYKLTFRGFMSLKWKAHVNPSTSEKEVRNTHEAIQALLHTKGYWSWPGWAAERVAKAYIEERSAKLTDLLTFAFLDKDVDGELCLSEVIPAIDVSDPSIDLAWSIANLAFDTVARVTEPDFKAIGGCLTPENLRSSIMDLAADEDGSGITKAKYNKLAIPEVTKDFCARDQIGLKSAHANLGYANVSEVDGIQGELKFFQLADALPNFIAEMNRERMVNVDGLDEPMKVASIDDITQERGRLELTAEQLENWLIREKGMSNGGFIGWFSDDSKYARKLAQNAVAWGDGTTTNSHQNAALAGGTKEWENVAARLELFVILDKSNDGQVQYKEAHPFLKKFLETPRRRPGPKRKTD